MAATAVGTLMAPEPQVPGRLPPRSMLDAVWLPLRALISAERCGGIPGLLVVLYKFGDAFALSLYSAFMIKGVGFSLDELSIAGKINMTVSAMVGAAVLGGWLYMRWGTFKSLLIFGIGQALTNLLYTWLAARREERSGCWRSATSLDTGIGGMGARGVHRLSRLLCAASNYSATQYALVVCPCGTAAHLDGIGGGISWSSRIGWANFFIVTCLTALPGYRACWSSCAARCRSLVEGAKHANAEAEAAGGAANPHDRTAGQVFRGVLRGGGTHLPHTALRRSHRRGEQPTLQTQDGWQIRGDRTRRSACCSRSPARSSSTSWASRSTRFRIAGGTLLFLIALEMVFARTSGSRSTPPETQEAKSREDISVFPLAFPFIAGPGALATILLMAGEAWGRPWLFAGFLCVVALVMTLSWGLMLATPRLMRVLGVTGANVASRLSGVVLAALAVQFIIDGIRGSFLNT